MHCRVIFSKNPPTSLKKPTSRVLLLEFRNAASIDIQNTIPLINETDPILQSIHDIVGPIIYKHHKYQFNESSRYCLEQIEGSNQSLCFHLNEEDRKLKGRTVTWEENNFSCSCNLHFRSEIIRRSRWNLQIKCRRHPTIIRGVYDLQNRFHISTIIKCFLERVILFVKRMSHTYNLIATINSPSPQHFNCSVFSPKIGSVVKEGWFFHDRLQNNGRIIQKKSFYEIVSEKPFVLINEQEDSLNPENLFVHL